MFREEQFFSYSIDTIFFLIYFFFTLEKVRCFLLDFTELEVIWINTAKDFLVIQMHMNTHVSSLGSWCCSGTVIHKGHGIAILAGFQDSAGQSHS